MESKCLKFGTQGDHELRYGMLVALDYKYMNRGCKEKAIYDYRNKSI